MTKFPYDAAYFTLAPDWVCEVLSPSTASLDRKEKLAVYARERVSWAWLVDPIGKTLESLRLEGERWTIVAVYKEGDVAKIQPFDAIDFALDDLWPAD